MVSPVSGFPSATGFPQSFNAGFNGDNVNHTFNSPPINIAPNGTSSILMPSISQALTPSPSSFGTGLGAVNASGLDDQSTAMFTQLLSAVLNKRDSQAKAQQEQKQQSMLMTILMFALSKKKRSAETEEA